MLRQAVGALIIQGDAYLLVHKVKMMDGKAGVEQIEGVWDFPKGGVTAQDASPEQALFRELAEETGSSRYRILHVFEEKIRFSFLPEDQLKLGFEGQETTMFLAAYEGDCSDLQPQDEEIDQVRFVPRSRMLETLAHPESRAFFARHPTPYPGVNALLQDLHAGAQTSLGDQWVGLYLSGSLAAGEFDPLRSDIDFVIVTAGELSPALVQALKALHAQLLDCHPAWGIKLEGSYIPLMALRRYDPSSAHFPSARTGGSFGDDQQGVDGIIHRAILREHGLAIAGPAPRDLVEPVPPDDLRRACAGILNEWWLPQLQDQHRLVEREYQAYAVLTMGRILYTLTFGEVVSKPIAARWAQETLEKRWTALIERALTWQPSDGISDLGETLDFIRYTLKHSV
jgi:8-oxo-dGTP pyrophosphatase MutT (NUDIX family)